MCGRSSLTKTEKEIEERFNATFYSDELDRYNPLPNYNIAPTHICPVIIGEDRSHLQLYRWGLIPFWAKDTKVGYKMINARIETIKEKATYKSAFSKRRCLVPLDGFYEWKNSNGEKQPYRIQTTDQEIFCVAGMWESWKSPQGEIIKSFTLITTPPNGFMAKIHDRMPAILTKEMEEVWLDPLMPSKDLLSMLENPYPSESMKSYKVSKRIGNVREKDAELIEEIE